ncbi:hypothetical protein LRP52_02295 [Photobacterium sp. ZSDE20]|uniref:KfrA N-terminal DNA-binding domain-containing protein n=1 Tax=Photobacterium pectinilyticum TaxID=2906793 RepID=A0ABT1MWM8_9GAMM|nr:hypothetical protein [Photobacterium sp. ZSDE20]MCQ1056901.1 hypothetical protein [Photobacterium sp. ZSDE20]MDD1821036.1 hypothetical protein [Photobacterium sp. ZSDE20]
MFNVRSICYKNRWLVFHTFLTIKCRYMAGNNMMEYGLNTHPLIKLTEATQSESLVKHFQSMMLAGKAIEAMTVDSTKQMLEHSYQQSLKLIEEMDKQLVYQQDQQQSLCFPFDLMDQITRNMADQWSALAGLPTSSADKLAQALEEAKATESELSGIVAEKESQLNELNQTVVAHQAEVTKANRAKQTAQRNARKVKADLEAASETSKQLEEQVTQLESEKAETAKENQALTQQNSDLKQQIAQLQSQLATVGQDS